MVTLRVYDTGSEDVSAPIGHERSVTVDHYVGLDVSLKETHFCVMDGPDNGGPSDRADNHETGEDEYSELDRKGRD